MDFLEGLNPQQREAVAHTEGPLLILAGAGSGKTRVITHRIAHIIATRHVPPAAILAVTFTNKAADEMRTRVASLLSGYELSSDPRVSTFHSFCVRLLRRDGDPLAQVRPGFTRQFTIYDDDDQLAIVKATYRRLGLDEKEFLQYRAALSRLSQAKNQKTGTSFVGFLPAVSDEAAKAIRQEIRGWKLHLRSGSHLKGLAQEINQVVRGWINYYGRYFPSWLTRTLQQINEYLVRWALRKYKKLHAHPTRAWRFLAAVSRREPNLFVHWTHGARP